MEWTEETENPTSWRTYGRLLQENDDLLLLETDGAIVLNVDSGTNWSES